MWSTKNVVLTSVNNEFWKVFGRWLQTEREKTGVTQEAVAKETSLNVKSISRLERGESGTKRKTIELLVTSINKLSHGYKLDKNEALRLAGYASESNIPPELIFEGFEGLDQDDIAEIVKQIQFKKFLKSQENKQK